MSPVASSLHPTIYVARRGPAVEAVAWEDPADPGVSTPLTHMRILEVATRIIPMEIPQVTITFAATLVEEQL